MPLNDTLRRFVLSSLSAHRVFFYSLFSTLAVSITILNALKNHSNFYSVAIYLSKSSRSVLVLANFGALISLFCGQIVQQIFFGSLRPAEVERLYDRLWFFVTESLLAFTIFRDEFDISFALMFGLLLFIKSFHWLASDRIEWMDQRPYPGPPTLFHIRMTSLFILLWIFDVLMFSFAIESTVSNGVGGMLLFASEYAILTASALNVTAKYTISVIDLRRARVRGGEAAPPWENKSMWVFYVELATDFLKLTTYLLFFLLIITFYGLPLNILREVYLTARSFITRLRALHRYQTATRNMDQRYPNATEEEMSAMTDRTCIICREEMVLRDALANAEDRGASGESATVIDGPNTTPKKLPCGHIFHFHCLRSWLERQQSCPTCRRTVLNTNDQRPPAPGAPQPGAQAPHPLGNQVPPPRGPAIPGGFNNPLGIFGRMFRNQAQQPILLDQLANGPRIPPFAQNAAPNLPIPAQQVWGTGQGLVIQYNFHYPPLRTGAQAQPSRPLPIFAGFHGPGGAWHPWGMDRRWFNPPPNEPAAAAQQPAQPLPTQATPTQAATPASQTNAQAPASPNDSSSPPSGSSAAQDTSSSEATSARRAAAQAALLRFNRYGATTSRAGPPSTDASSSRTNGATATPAPAADGKTASPTSDHRSNHDDRCTVPTMIPLSEPRPTLASASPSGIISPPFPMHHSYPSRNLHRNHASSSRATNGPTSVPQQQFSPYFQSPTATAARNAPFDGPSPPVVEFPRTMTDAQLFGMDRFTREAIDEQLRVLQSVSGALQRSVEDLMRVRSVLPSQRTASGSVPGESDTVTSAVAPVPSMRDLLLNTGLDDVNTTPAASNHHARLGEEDRRVPDQLPSTTQLNSSSEPDDGREQS